MKPILEIMHVSKKFRINNEARPYLSIRDSLADALRSTKKRKEDFWALKDVSFQVQEGESIGIIGKNGAGKSTLLKILSKITPPTSGKIISRGRIASLLEVGTGFHPELTGRENIFLNGSILGLKRREIIEKFDEIVEFSGVENFLDTPLKHYSSGMQLRLAFAVAAFLENEILIIDEVLAVGDAQFQKKCMNKMESVSKSGRTILIVSHNLVQIQSLCSKCIYLDKGTVLQSDTTDQVIRNYMFSGMNLYVNDLSEMPRLGYTNPIFRFTKIELISKTPIFEGSEVCFRLNFETTSSLNNLMIGFSIKDHLNTNFIECRSSPKDLKTETQGIVDFNFQLKLKAGFYTLSVGSKSDEGFLDTVPGALLLEVKKMNDLGDSDWANSNNGYFITDTSWTYK
jgi:ABC-type polysaccharide/polyol phosphate transport system ATPase subunit